MTTAIVLNSLAILSGLVLLYFGGNFLVKGAGGLALKFKIQPIVVGLTVVAFGTSAPELFVSLVSAVQGYSGISLGNVVGSNTINIALILGLSALLIPISVSSGIIKRDTPLMFASYGLVFLCVLPLPWEGLTGGGGKIFRYEGLLLIGALVAYVWYLLHSSRKQSDVEPSEDLDADQAKRPMYFLALEIIGGIVALAFGSDFLVDGASFMARNLFGASDRFIGITIVAFGTSLPELITSVVAAAKKEMDISVGNIVGSNIFNCLMVLGATSIIQPLDVATQGFTVDLFFMLAVSMFLMAVISIKKRLGRVSAVILLASYVGYFMYLLQSKGI